MNTLIIGMGEIGSALNEVLKEKYKVATKDTGEISNPLPYYDVIHICYPYSDKFEKITRDYILEFQALNFKKNVHFSVIIHSSVPVGTTNHIHSLKSGAYSVFHSPVRGKHPDLIDGVKVYKKYLSYDFDEKRVKEVADYFIVAGIDIKIMRGTKKTELMKLLALSRYGVYLAFAKEQESICKHFGYEYEDVVTDFERSRNEGLKRLGLYYKLAHPLLTPFESFVGGHCTVEDMELLLNQHKTPLLQASYDIDRNTQVWGNSNIYKSAKIGKGCSVGQFCEIGENVKIGNNVRIGAFVFIPEGVTIEDNVFIAPKVTFSNDKHPPSDRQYWGKIVVKRNATIGMGSIILPGVTIGENALIGAGSIVTKNVGDNELWYGKAAEKKADIMVDARTVN